MSYAVIHVQKFKMNDVKGIQIHNQRESPNSKNTDIEKEKSSLNYDLRNPEPVNYNHKVKEIIKEGYTIDKAIRKDAVVMTGTLVTSDKEFFSKLDQAEQKKYFQDAYDYLKDRYGEKNIVAAVVHLDEKTPHMHVISVPITDDGRLSAKTLFDRKALRELQDQLPKVLQDKGFEIKRGELGSEKIHVSPAEFKKQEIKSLENEIKDLQNIVVDRQNNLKALQGELKGVQGELTKIEGLKLNFDRIDRIQAKEGRLSKGKVTINKDDFEELRTIAKKYGVLENKVKNLEHQNQSMSRDVDKLYSGRQENQSKTFDTQRQLVAVNSKLGLVVDFLKATDQVEKADKFIREQTQKQAVKIRVHDENEL